MICVSDKWKDYELLETGNGEKTNDGEAIY
jgi:hypothetical protein